MKLQKQVETHQTSIQRAFETCNHNTQVIDVLTEELAQFTDKLQFLQNIIDASSNQHNHKLEESSEASETMEDSTAFAAINKLESTIRKHNETISELKKFQKIVQNLKSFSTLERKALKKLNVTQMLKEELHKIESKWSDFENWLQQWLDKDVDMPQINSTQPPENEESNPKRDEKPLLFGDPMENHGVSWDDSSSNLDTKSSSTPTDKQVVLTQQFGWTPMLELLRTWWEQTRAAT